MPAYVALLRAVNVGGTGKLPMSDLVAMAKSAGFQRARTYIASGNLVLESDSSEQQIKAVLEEALAGYAGKPVGVMVRSAAQMSEVLAANPFPEKAPNRTVVVFLDEAPPDDWQAGMVAPGGEEARAGTRELYIHFGEGMGQSRFKLPAAARGTARNINTVTRLAAMALE
ncbi:MULTISPECIES: DUF1697 domain-containing protein [Luteimonas]|uniref:DUF1697 domain-containing protein n=1 Tax=Luteimonas chenhongjianii TaxID=2006110 RepID=A0A290XEM2_9GAMM|nr:MULTISPECIES: DUF1697 domain-containing protein [Luteimonas]ATD67533.1 hypothetical protein CNR27_08870 [Luteimonas chenhongjianii]RPD83665.1 DUF1697 domain-containing protein [Luteimonas sp. 100069]